MSESKGDYRDDMFICAGCERQQFKRTPPQFVTAMQEEIAALRKRNAEVEAMVCDGFTCYPYAVKFAALEKVAEAGRQLRNHFVLMLEDDDQEPERWAEYFAIKAAYDSALREAGHLKEGG